MVLLLTATRTSPRPRRYCPLTITGGYRIGWTQNHLANVSQRLKRRMRIPGLRFVFYRAGLVHALHSKSSCPLVIAAFHGWVLDTLGASSVSVAATCESWQENDPAMVR